MGSSTRFTIATPTVLTFDQVQALTEAVLNRMPCSPFGPVDTFLYPVQIDDGFPFGADILAYPAFAGEQMWSLDGGTFRLSLSILSDFRPFDPDVAGSPTRRQAFLDMLSTISCAEPGTLIGYWIAEHAELSHPVIEVETGVRLAFGAGSGIWKEHLDGPQTPVPSRVPTSFVSEDDGQTIRLDTAGVVAWVRSAKVAA
jgi:hypothetical protein